ncbi:MAG: hypothetical protein IJ574_03190 [Bacilli bacterium]|nr:hypothetical protein [Bacilli bacterium]
MDYLDYLKTLNSGQLQTAISSRLARLEQIKKECDFIGYDLDINPSLKNINNITDNELKINITINNCWRGYIPLKTKVIYGITRNENNMYCNSGDYYYIDTNEYLPECINYLINSEIYNEYDLYDYLLKFIIKYFGITKQNKRDKYYTLISKNDTSYFNPTNHRLFSDFKNSNMALCTEYGIIAQNVLSFLGCDIDYVLGSILIQDETTKVFDEVYHAFNIIKRKPTNQSTVNILDFSCYTKTYDTSFNYLNSTPFISSYDLTHEYDSFINGEIDIEEYEYIYEKYNNSYAPVINNKKRIYSMNQDLNF